MVANMPNVVFSCALLKWKLQMHFQINIVAVLMAYVVTSHRQNTDFWGVSSTTRSPSYAFVHGRLL